LTLIHEANNISAEAILQNKLAHLRTTLWENGYSARQIHISFHPMQKQVRQQLRRNWRGNYFFHMYSLSSLISRTLQW